MEEHKSVSIHTSSGYIAHGYILDQWTAGLILQTIDDFMVDGYSFYPQKSIKKLDSSMSNTRLFFERIYQEEWILEEIDFSKEFSFESISDFFSKYLLQKDVLVEYTDGKVFFGRVLGVDSEEVLLQIFDSNGTWQWKQVIDLTSIFVVQWDTLYLAQFSKRLQKIDKD